MYPVLISAHTLGPSCESASVSTRPSPPLAWCLLQCLSSRSPSLILHCVILQQTEIVVQVTAHEVVVSLAWQEQALWAPSSAAGGLEGAADD